MQLSDASWTDADDLETDLAVVPVGSTEQHGPHAPLGTDTMAAEAIATAGVERADESAVVTPAIPVGIAEEHRQFTGTLWVTPDTFRAYVRDVVESLAGHGWDRVVIVNGHGGNVNALQEVSARLTRDETAYVAPFTWFDAINPAEVDDSLGMGHGGPLETSLIQHLDAALVHEDRFDEAVAGAAETWGDWQSGTNLAADTAEFSESGIVGDPSEASAEIGAQLLDLASEELAALLDAVATRDTSRPSHK